MTFMQMMGIIILKLWWMLIPAIVGWVYGIKQDKKEDEEWTTQ